MARLQKHFLNPQLATYVNLKTNLAQGSDIQYVGEASATVKTDSIINQGFVKRKWANLLKTKTIAAEESSKPTDASVTVISSISFICVPV